MIVNEVLPEKLVFGTDCDVAHMSREVTLWMHARPVHLLCTMSFKIPVP